MRRSPMVTCCSRFAALVFVIGRLACAATLPPRAPPTCLWCWTNSTADCAIPLPPWPHVNPFPESQRDSTGHGPDFPGSAGDREQGKFRPSVTPRLVTVAVVNDDGSRIGSFEMPSNDEIVFWLKALYVGLVAKGVAEDVTDGLLSEGL